jgi:exonuclease VII large subunit
VIGDSTLTIITPDDTLTHRLPLDSMPDFGGTAFSVAPDSLLRQFRLDRERLDRMGEEAQEMVKRMKQEEAERLREQARRLLEQAERLEERARRMREQEDRRQEQEGAPAPDTSAASDRGALWGRLTGRLDRGTPPVRWRVVPREEARPQSAALWVRIADGPRLVGYPSGHRSRAERAARPAIRLLETARYVKTVRHVRSAGQVQAQTARLTGLEPSGYALRVVQVVPSSAQIVSSTPQRSAQHQAWRTMVL